MENVELTQLLGAGGIAVVVGLLVGGLIRPWLKPTMTTVDPSSGENVVSKWYKPVMNTVAFLAAFGLALLAAFALDAYDTVSLVIANSLSLVIANSLLVGLVGFTSAIGVAEVTKS